MTKTRMWSPTAKPAVLATGRRRTPASVGATMVDSKLLVLVLVGRLPLKWMKAPPKDHCVVITPAEGQKWDSDRSGLWAAVG